MVEFLNNLNRIDYDIFDEDYLNELLGSRDSQLSLYSKLVLAEDQTYILRESNEIMYMHESDL